MTSIPKHKFFSIGESAITVDFGNVISAEINAYAVGLCEAIRANPFRGLIDAVPCYSSVTVFFDVVAVSRHVAYGEGCFSYVRQFITEKLTEFKESGENKRREFTIPVDFSDASAPDLEFVAERAKLSKDEVIEIFLTPEYRVYMLGFLPGFPYMGEVDKRIAAPRLDSPRQKVSAGSVGIAGSQTGIYPFESPGGWRLIGRTETEIFRRDGDSPAIFSAGDVVRFVRA